MDILTLIILILAPLLFVRVYVVHKVSMRRINEIHKINMERIAAGQFDNLLSYYDNIRIFDLTKWTYKQFYGLE